MTQNGTNMQQAEAFAERMITMLNEGPLVLMTSAVEPQILDVFRNGGGVSYSAFTRF